MKIAIYGHFINLIKQATTGGNDEKRKIIEIFKSVKQNTTVGHVQFQ